MEKPLISCSDEYIRFLKWIAAGNCSARQIVDIIEKPHHFMPELKRFQHSEEKKDEVK